MIRGYPAPLRPTDALPRSDRGRFDRKSQVNLIVLSFEQLCSPIVTRRAWRVYAPSFRLFIRASQLQRLSPTRLSVTGRDSITISRNLYGSHRYSFLIGTTPRLHVVSLYRSTRLSWTKTRVAPLIRADQFSTAEGTRPELFQLAFSTRHVISRFIFDHRRRCSVFRPLTRNCACCAPRRNT